MHCLIAKGPSISPSPASQGWWNAGDVAEYWRLWNMPVHKWLLRHVYYPCMRLGMGKWWAGTVVFAISAAFHELLIGLPLHMITFWAFIGLMCQVGFSTHLPWSSPAAYHLEQTV